MTNPIPLSWSSLNFLHDRVWFHHFMMVYGKLLDKTYTIYAKNDQNDPKMRLYDVIMTSKSTFLKKFEKFYFWKKNSLQNINWWFFAISRIFGSKPKKVHFSAILAYFLYKSPIKRWVSKNIVDYPISQFSNFPKICILTL